ncbi:FAD-binding oxidoreductase [Motiliproteus coralliicola]|uniref:FAD-binding oxidoreductase n=1 Tax=Motiliproteus coralliicola TaxID=2283196 RepID=A0A369WBM7_9GAMM|nr:FAD-binding oxidoreductase [Motiliproteus coralliicola]RDE19142.1 FAD-binding oxidoreductase [Motiliproteus coralliicola]
MSLTGYETSYYTASANPATAYPMLNEAVDADICVIGAGFTGLSAALHLAERGYKVVVLEAQRVGWGASGRNGGQVGVGQRQGQQELEKMLGNEHARALWDLAEESVALVKQLIEDHQIQCDLKPGILHTAHKPGYVAEMREEVEHLQRHYNYDAVEFVEQDELRQMLDTDYYYGGQRFHNAAHLHPLNYALGLADAATKAGATIYEHSAVLETDEDGSTLLKTAKGSVRAKQVVLACNGYLEKLEPRVAGKIMPINNFIIATEPLDESLARKLIRDDVAVADSKFVINYYRLSADNRLLFGGGENYRRSFPSDIKGFVRRYMLDVYPQLEDVNIDYDWGGTLAVTMNRMPHFGRVGDNTYVAQGYSGHGVAMATLGGKLLAEALSGTLERFDQFAKVPTPTFPGGTLLRWPGMVAGMLYYSIRDRL